MRRPPPIQADLAGRTVLVTGASAGIGKEAARVLARLGAHVVMACRNAEKGEHARRQISTGARGQVDLMIVDLSSQKAIREFAVMFQARHPALHVLVNNAGVWLHQRFVTEEGIETTWATNQLGYFLLTQLLMEPLRAAAPSRIVNVASDLAHGLDLDDVEFRRRPYDGKSAYAQSKQANRMWNSALARRVEGTGVTVNVMHPGLVSTELFGKGGGVIATAVSATVSVIGRSVQKGADTVVWLAAASELATVSGQYWMDRREHTCRFRDQAQQEALWALCERMTTRA